MQSIYCPRTKQKPGGSIPETTGFSGLNLDVFERATHFEEAGPTLYMRVAAERCATLTLSQSSPHSELNSVIQCVGATIKQDWTVLTNLCRFPLGGPLHKESVWVAFTAASLSNPLPTFRIELPGRSYEVGATAPATDK